MSRLACSHLADMVVCALSHSLGPTSGAAMALPAGPATLLHTLLLLSSGTPLFIP